MKPTKKLEVELRNEYEPENLQLRDTVKRQAFELEQCKRELEIEAALERVRGRAMAMRSSEELNVLIGTVFSELTKLDLVLTRCVILIYEGGDKGFRWWMANSEAPSTPMNFFVKYADMPFFNEYLKAWNERTLKWQYILEGENKIKTDDFLFHETELSSLPDFVISGMRAPGRVYLNASFNNFGNLTLASLEPLSNEHFDILLRFAKVFDLTYTRFNDLKQAEAQAREARVQLALERVRARTMAMQRSEELADTAHILFQQFKELGEDPIQITIGIFNEKEQIIEFRITGLDGSGSKVDQAFDMDMNEPILLNKIYEQWKNQKKSAVIELSGSELLDWGAYRNKVAGTYGPVVDFNPGDRRYVNVGLFSKGMVSVSSPEPLSAETLPILERFAAVFDLSYTRFLDLKNAEAQAREAQIEAALEKVRARVMSMKVSADLNETSLVFGEQLRKLGIDWQFSYFWLIEEEKDNNTFWITWPDKKTSTTSYSLTEADESFRECIIAWRQQIKIHSSQVPLMDVPAWIDTFERITNDAGGIAPEIMTPANFKDGVYYYDAMIKFGSFGILMNRPVTEEEKNIQVRFAVEFERAYTRFLDLQKAEAQAREAQIEAALERVRSRSMGMQKSEELKEIIRVVYEQFVQLNIHVEHAGFIMDYKERDDMQIWLADEHQVPFQVTIPYFDCQHWNSYIEAKQKGANFFTNHLGFEEKNRFYQDLFKLFPVPDETKQYYLTCPGLAISTVLLDSVGLYIENFSGVPYTDEENNILMRFGKVFQQTYTRFLDLQRAEALARESQIQLALERLRARTMAMHKSEELAEAASVMFEQLSLLGASLWICGFTICKKDSDIVESWISPPNGKMIDPMYVPYTIDQFSTSAYFAWKAHGPMYTDIKEGTELQEGHESLLRQPAMETARNYLVKNSIALPSWVQRFAVPYTFGYLMIVTTKLFEETDILQRFAKVFDQTYTRFLDLQKAEGQAREAQIEAALERVRSRTMGMQRSDELKEAAMLLFQQVLNLGVPAFGSGFNIWDTDRQAATAWMAGVDRLQPPFKTSSSEDVFFRIRQAAEQGDALFVEEQEGATLKAHYEYMNSIPVFREIADKMAATGQSFPTFQIMHCAFFSHGYLMFITFEPAVYAYDIFKRFAKVFEQTYTRFLDLQKAEAQAREAQIEAALERVRSRTMAMQRSAELPETASVLFKQLIHLGIQPNRLYINIIKDGKGEAEFWITDEEGSKLTTTYSADMNANPTFKKIFDGWKSQNKSLILDIQGKEVEEYFRHLSSLKVPFNKEVSHNRRLQYVAYFSRGFIGMASPVEQPAETMQLLERFAAVFNLTFTRFNDLKIAEAHAMQAERDLIEIKAAKQKAEEALAELQVTQKQLIQSEKMASLGELTAGIAHEIQNPLNFVNNFSDVSNELLDEMKEQLAIGNMQQAMGLADDVRQNLEKINHHGKRADAIVKGMLQHSRTGSGQKEPTDINALCDEYLRLAYHGLRAKDKSFNAKIETDFDKSIGKVNVMPQEMGRAILNLINNAFYAAPRLSEREVKDHERTHEPKVWVSTKKVNDTILVSIRDNGPGIPSNILDKIFQPFFTTKPTGQGTGLGLSLAFDIVTKGHGGELKAETKEGEGSTFIIQLPAN